MTTETESAIESIKEARTPYDLFGELTGNRLEKLHQAKTIFIRLVKLVHPDTANGDSDELNESFSRLKDLWERAIEVISTDSYGEGGFTGLTVTTKKGVHYTIGGRIAHGDISDIHRCGDGLIKIARITRDNDLLRAEANNLRVIRGDCKEDMRLFLPEIKASLGIRDKKRRELAANIFSPLPNASDWVSLHEVHRRLPIVNPQDAAWIWRRILTALSLAHAAGYVHQAVFPENVLILPEQHGVVLNDWCYSREIGAKPIAIIPRYRTWYPEEVMKKEKVLPETDVMLAARTMMLLLGGNGFAAPATVPAAIRAHLKACTLPKASMRSGDVLGILKSFDEIIWRLWGKRRFREFKLPNK